MDNKVIRNHILPVTIKRIKLFYRQKENLYLLVIILGNSILYRDDIIHFKIGLIKVTIKRQEIVISFNILLLDKDKAVLKMPFL